MAATSSAVANDEPRRQQLRKEHGVRIVESANEGAGIDDQPAGTYGFTYSPTAAAPVFALRKYQNFEIHRAPSGDKFLIGYLTAAELDAISKKSPADLKLYPDPFEQSTELVCLAMRDVFPRSQHSGQPGSPAPLRFEP